MTVDALAVLSELARKSELLDPAWLFEIDDFDEPPLFTRIAEVDALFAIPMQRRCAYMVEFMFDLYGRYAAALDANPELRSSFLVITLQDWDLFWSEDEPLFCAPTSREAKIARQWSLDAGIGDALVADGIAELAARQDPVDRVFVSRNRRQSFHSVVDFLTPAVPS